MPIYEQSVNVTKVLYGGTPPGESQRVALKSHTAGLRACRIGNFRYESAPKKRFFENLAWGRVSQVRTVTPNFTVLAQQMWAYGPKIVKKILICGIHFPQRGIFPQAIFTKFCLGEGAPGPHCRAKCQRCSFKTVAVRHQKSPKMVIFGNIFPSGKIMGVDRKT